MIEVKIDFHHSKIIFFKINIWYKIILNLYHIFIISFIFDELIERLTHKSTRSKNLGFSKWFDSSEMGRSPIDRSLDRVQSNFNSSKFDPSDLILFNNYIFRSSELILVDWNFYKIAKKFCKLFSINWFSFENIMSFEVHSCEKYFELIFEFTL